ncbi:MAG: DUF3021 family protein [Firmicutes bacterium]|nr:DUF3021 family protein [Bacillota bacterium]
MKLKAALIFMFHLFCAITTFETLFIAVNGALGSITLTLEAKELFKIPFIAFMSVLPVLLLVKAEKISRTEIMIRRAIHFVLTAGIVFGLLIYFKWLDTANAVIIAVFFLAIYATASIVKEIQAKKLADKLNERINAFHKAENATYRDKP